MPGRKKTPLPAIVVMMPFESTRRMRKFPVSAEVEIALGVEPGEGGLIERGIEGRAAIAGEARNAVSGESLDRAVATDAANDVRDSVAEDDVAGKVERDAVDSQRNVLRGDAGADFPPGKCIDHYLGEERRGGEGEDHREAGDGN